MRKFLILATIILATQTVFAATTQTTGFIPGPVWLSSNTLVAGDTVKIHTAVWNGDTKELSAHVEFYDKSVVLGARDVVVPASELKDVSIGWVTTAGDHYISAKIVSSSIISGGKKETTTVSLKETAEDHIFVPAKESTATSSEILKKQMSKATADLGSILPPAVSTKVSGSFSSIDAVRDATYSAIVDSKALTQKEITAMNAPKPKVQTGDAKVLDATQKPIAYVKLFFLSVFEFIFGNKIVFYGLIIVLLFLIIRSIYRRIKNR